MPDPEVLEKGLHFELDCEVRLEKFIPMVCEVPHTVTGTSREEIENKLLALEDMSLEDLAEELLGEDWWDDKHGWHYEDSEVLCTGDLYENGPEFEWGDVDDMVPQEGDC